MIIGKWDTLRLKVSHKKKFRQGLPRMFGESIMSKLVEWKSGHYLNLMTVFSMSGCDFLRFTEVFRTPHDSVQFTLDRFQ